MNEYLQIVLFVIIFFLGWWGREWSAKRQVDAMLKEIAEEETAVVDGNKIRITVEKHDGCFYIYDRSGTYLSHGESFDIVEAILKEKFPGKLFAASEEDLAKLNS